MITDSDLKKLKSALAPEFKRIENKIDEVNTKVDSLKLRIDIFEDNITGDIANLQNENLITSTYRVSIEDHEQRIINLESKQNVN